MPCETSPLPKNCFKLIVWWNKQYLVSLMERFHPNHIENRMTQCTQLLQQRKRCHRKMPYMISSRSVADGISLSVSKWKLVYRSLISVKNKVKWICLLTQQQLETVSVRHTQVTLLMWRVPHLWGEKCNANGAHDAINHFVRIFAKCSPILKILLPANWIINV